MSRDPLGDWAHVIRLLRGVSARQWHSATREFILLPAYRFIDNRSVDQLDLLGQVNWKEKWCFLCILPMPDSYMYFLGVGLMAKTIAAQKYPPIPPSTVDTQEANAYRHCLWACTLTKLWGDKDAAALEECHEKNTPGGTPADDAIDAYNNSIGNAFGKNPASCESQCDAAMPPGGPPTLKLEWP